MEWEELLNMYYYYDILLNFGSEELYDFYEWESSDALEYVKKIPLFRVSTDTLFDNLTYHITYDEEVLLQIQDKTVLKNDESPKENLMLISDNKNALALELDDAGNVISRSKLLLNDEENLLEMLYTLKESPLSYKKGKKYKERRELRQIAKVKQLISCEIDTLYTTKNFSKLKYLYYEWFNKSSEDIMEMIAEMKEHLQNYNEDVQKIYDFIKLSYNK